MLNFCSNCEELDAPGVVGIFPGIFLVETTFLVAQSFLANVPFVAGRLQSGAAAEAERALTGACAADQLTLKEKQRAAETLSGGKWREGEGCTCQDYPGLLEILFQSE